MRVLLWGLQSPINIGMILRSCEVYHTPALIFDPHGVTRDQDKTRVISDFACGAWTRTPPSIVEAGGLELELARGRLVATSIDPRAEPVQGFDWRDDDCLMVGNEYDGLPADAMARASVELTIPMPPGHLPKPPSFRPIDPGRRAGVSKEGKPNLNVAIATSILVYLAFARKPPATD